MRTSRLIITRSLLTGKYGNYSNYISTNIGSLDDIKNKTTDLSQKQIQSLVETGTEHAIKALKIIDKQLSEMNTDSVTSSVTFNAGILQITFSTTGTKTSNKNKKD